MKIKSYSINYIDKYGNDQGTFGGCKETKEATLESLRAWAAKWGHTLIEESYIERETDDNPAFVDACLGDIAGFHR